MRTSLNHQPEAQHPKSSVIHKLLADSPIFRVHRDQSAPWHGMLSLTAKP